MLSLFQWLRCHGLTVPVVAVTGNALSEDVSAFKAAGAECVLTKPINRALLVQALKTHLPTHLAAQIAQQKAPKQY